MTNPSIIPSKAAYLAGEPVAIDVASVPPGARLVVTHLAEVVRSTGLTPDSARAELGTYAPGGYGVDLVGADGTTLASTAFDVWSRPFERPRYGFVAHHAGVGPAAIADHFRRLHLTSAQFYDWAWRYTDLLGPEEYADTLGNPVSLPAVRSVIAALHDAGATALGYVALYGVPMNEWDRWAALGLYRSDGTPHTLGEDFLGIVDPGNPGWQAHLVPQFAAVCDAVGFDGFHLDQYGGPKQGLRADGTVCDLTGAFPAMITAIAEATPGAHLVFNNVNGFPLAHTAGSPQAGLYTEVWAPRSDLRDLAALAAESRALGEARLPTILSAYLSVYAHQDARTADRTAQLAMATIFSCGATHLLNGEDGTILTGPYYPDNHRADAMSLDLMRRWYDFLVRYGDLLVAPDVEDVTGQYYSGVNEELAIHAPDGVRLSIHPDPGTVWVRVTRTDGGLTVHLVNLTDQTEAGWDTPKRPFTPVPGLALRVRKVTRVPSPAWWADPDRPGPMTALPVADEPRHATCELPPLDVWGLIHLPFATRRLSKRPCRGRGVETPGSNAGSEPR